MAEQELARHKHRRREVSMADINRRAHERSPYMETAEGGPMVCYHPGRGSTAHPLRLKLFVASADCARTAEVVCAANSRGHRCSYAPALVLPTPQPQMDARKEEHFRPSCGAYWLIISRRISSRRGFWLWDMLMTF